MAAGGASLQGIRSENQDRFLVEVSDDGRRAVGAIADGIGGLADGAGAAAAAIDAVRAFCNWLFSEASPADIRQRIEGLYDAANTEIVERAGAQARSGTTLVLAVVTETSLIIANVGDSRAWIYMNPGLERLTADHSVVEELVRDGALTLEQAATSPYRNLLTRSLGDSSPEVDVQLEDGGRQALAAEAAIILTSDGAHGVAGIMDQVRVAEALEDCPDLNGVSEALCKAAVDAGSRDNATVVILRRG